MIAITDPGVELSSCAFEPDDRQMVAVLEMADNEPQHRHASDVATMLGSRFGSAYLASRSVPRRLHSGADLVWRATSKPLVRAMLVVPNDVCNELCLELGQSTWHEDASSALVLER